MPPDLTPLAARAAALVPDGAAVGLGSGRTATAFIRALGDRVAAGLRVRGVPTSEASAELATRLGIPLATLDEADALAVAIDGADEVDPAGNLVKGFGGALVREKVVAAAAARFVIVVTADKLVPALGSRGRLPVEVVPFAVAPVRRTLAAMGWTPEVRSADGRPFVTDNGNHILDCGVPTLGDPAAAEDALRRTPGVLGTGLFLNMADLILVQHPDGRVEERPVTRV